MIKVIPYEGFDDITFEMSFKEVKELLREKHVQFNTENWPNKERLSGNSSQRNFFRDEHYRC